MPRRPQHRKNRRTVSDPDYTNDFEPMPLIQGHVSRVRRFEIGGKTLMITPPKRMLQHGRTVSVSLPRRVDANEREIPVRLVRMVAGNLLEDRQRVCPFPVSDTLIQKRCQPLFIGSGIGRQPERGARVSLAGQGSAMRNGTAPKCMCEGWKKLQVLLRLRVHPAGGWIGRKRQGERVEHPLCVILLRHLHCRRPYLNNCRVHPCHGHSPHAALVQAAPICSICRWSVPQQPPSTLICENCTRRSLYCWPSSMGSPSSRSGAASSSVWLRFDALARMPRSLSIHAWPLRTASKWLGWAQLII